MYSGVLWAWDKRSAVPHNCTPSLANFHIFLGIYASVGGRYLLNPFPPSVVNNSFLEIIYGVGVCVFLVQPYVLFGVFGLLVW